MPKPSKFAQTDFAAQHQPPDAVRAWRMAWLPEEITWRDDYQARADLEHHEYLELKKKQAMQDRIYFGDALWGASKDQREAQFDAPRLTANQLPLLATEKDLATWFGLSLGKLRSFTRDESAELNWHYTRYSLPKRNGKERIILAPKRQLKAMQRRVLREMLDQLPAPIHAHGFVRGRSILTNARPHVGKAYVLKLDLKEFFPSIDFPRIRGLFIWMGYSFAVASVLAMLCTEYDRISYQRANRVYYISQGTRHLIQGAPTSPLLANLIAFKLDKRLKGLADAHGFAYTRYADDLTFSGDNYEALLKVLNLAQKIVAEEDLVVNKEKIRILRRSRRQQVTGIVVNDKTTTPRERRRLVEAILHNAQKTGLQEQNREGSANFRAYIQGLIGYISAADPERGQRLLSTLQNIPD